jgi:hypothetical protein
LRTGSYGKIKDLYHSEANSFSLNYFHRCRWHRTGTGRGTGEIGLGESMHLRNFASVSWIKTADCGGSSCSAVASFYVGSAREDA